VSDKNSNIILAEQQQRPNRKPWEMLPNETPAPWEAFQCFLAQVPPRKIRQTAHELGLSRSTVGHYSSDFRWAERAAAWDAELARIRSERILRIAANLQEEHLRSLEAARTLGTRRLTDLLEENGWKEITAKEALSLVVEAIKLERLIIGAASERIEETSHVSHDIDWGKLSDEEAERAMRLRIELEQIERKAGK
jgi:hypothetical protein